MVNDTTSDLFVSPPSGVLDAEQAKLEAAYKQAMAQYVAAEQAAAKAAVVDDGKAYSMHDVPGLGRYVIPRRTGWQFLLDIIHDPVPNIDFSANIYPAFDGVIGERFQSPYLLDPLHNKYESYESLRDNLAAVRNFLMERYFAVDTTVTTAEAKKNLDEIARFIGDGLYNNFLFGGVIPNHDPDKPFIDLERAREGGGAGAQYIYERILAHNRHSTWMRPFEALVAMFGGKKTDWKLPDADKTHFTELLHHDLATQVSGNPGLDAVNAAIAGAVANVNAIQARLDAVRDAKALNNTAIDLENIGNNLIYTANNMQGVAQLSEPVRRDAVEIAKDILRKLKISIGDLNVMDGLKMKPSEDMAVFGSIKGVARVYERLIAWARGNNDSKVLQHESVLAATQAIAQVGYLAKQEALRMATLSGDAVMANNISEQLKLLPPSYAPKPGTKLGDLLDTIQNGMETILNRTQQVGVDGGQIGHALDGNLGGVNTIPTAGIANQAGVNNAAGRNNQAQMADDLAAQHEAARVNSLMAAQARRNGQAAATQPTPARSTAGRQSLGTAKAAKQQAAVVSTGRVSSTAPLTMAQQQAAMRANTTAGLNARRNSLSHHEEEEHEAILRAQQAQRLAAAAKIKATALKLPPGIGYSTKGMTGAPVMPGRDISPQGVLAKRTTAAPGVGIAPQTVKTQSVDGVDHSHDHDHDLHPVPQPVPPVRGGGRGY